jgi:hypothetical protein
MHYKKTELGQTAFQTRSVSLSPRQRSAFILFDGKRSVEEVLKATISLGVVMDDVRLLVAMGMLDTVNGAATAAPPASMPTPVPLAVPAKTLTPGPSPVTPTSGPTALDQAHYSRAYPIATRLTAALGLRGFRLNLAVEAAGDLAKLKELAPKIREAVGLEKFQELENALYD